MGFAEQLRKARLSLGMTQQQVADALGITSSTYCGYETGKRQPDVLKLKRLADILHTSGDVLLETGLGSDSDSDSYTASDEISEIISRLSPQLRECALEQIKVLYELQKKLSDE